MYYFKQCLFKPASGANNSLYNDEAELNLSTNPHIVAAGYKNKPTYLGVGMQPPKKFRQAFVWFVFSIKILDLV